MLGGFEELMDPDIKDSNEFIVAARKLLQFGSERALGKSQNKFHISFISPYSY